MRPDIVVHYLEVVLLVVLLLAIMLLASFVIGRFRRRHRRGYFQGLRLRGLELLFKEAEEEVMSGLQLLMRFGLPSPASGRVLARLVELTRADNDGIARLARLALKKVTRESDGSLRSVTSVSHS
jgi:hypothetical protein